MTLSLDLQEAPGGATMRSTTSFCNGDRLHLQGLNVCWDQNLESQREWNSSIREDIPSCGDICQPSVCNVMLQSAVGSRLVYSRWKTNLIMSGVETLKGRLPSTLTLGISPSQPLLRTSGNSLVQKGGWYKQARIVEPAHIKGENIASVNHKTSTRCFPRMH